MARARVNATRWIQRFDIKRRLLHQLAADIRECRHRLRRHRDLVECRLAFSRTAGLCQPVRRRPTGLARDVEIAHQTREHGGAHTVDHHRVAQHVDEAASEQIGGDQVPARRRCTDCQVALHRLKQDHNSAPACPTFQPLPWKLQLKRCSTLGGCITWICQGIDDVAASSTGFLSSGRHWHPAAVLLILSMTMPRN